MTLLLPCFRSLLLLHLVLWTTKAQDLAARHDPNPIIYPGQVNIGVLANIHDPGTNDTGSGCGPLRQEAVQKVMSAVWAAHQVNFMKDDPQELNIGVYIFDTCGTEDIAQRQVYRLLGHVGHVQTTACTEKKIPPLFAVIADGNKETLRLPMKLLNAFDIPIVSTSKTPPWHQQAYSDNYLSTAPTTGGLARAAVSVLRQSRLLEVAVIAEDRPQTSLYADFSREAQISGMQAFPVNHPSVVGDPDNFLASLQVVSEYGRSRLKAVVFLVGPDQAVDLLRSVDETNFPLMPWVIITSEDISSKILSTFQRQELRRLQQILLLSPEEVKVPEFQAYFQELLKDDTIKYHPLLVEFVNSVAEGSTKTAASNTSPVQDPKSQSSSSSNLTDAESQDTLSFKPADVSPTVKAVWALAAALKSVQKRSCRRGTDCLMYLRRSLSSYVLKTARSLDYMTYMPGASALEGDRIKFRDDGVLSSVRFSLKGFTYMGDIEEVGWYSDESGLTVDHDIVSPVNGFGFKEDDPNAPPTTESPVLLSKYKQYSGAARLTTTAAKTSTESNHFSTITHHIIHLGGDEYANWHILDDTHMNISPIINPNITDMPEETVDSPPSPSVLTKEDTSSEDLSSSEYNLEKEPANISDYLTNHDHDYNIVIGPSYGTGHPSSSNFRSISLTSHNEPKLKDGYRASRPNPSISMSLPAYAAPDETPRTLEGNSPKHESSAATEDVKVVIASKPLHLSAWLGRPWALAVLGLCGFGILVTLYILVFLMVKACEGSLKKNNSFLAVSQLLSLLTLYVAAALFTWKPSPILCGLQRFIPNVSYAFCFGCLLLKGMHLRAQNSLGLGGSVNRFNQLLTLFFVVGVQVALETQWWFIRPPTVIDDSMECDVRKEEILESQGYISFLLLLSVLVAVSTRKIPYNYREGRTLIVTTLTCLAFFLAWDAACWLLPDSSCRDIAAPVALMVTAIVVLAGIFGPQLFAIHKYGGFPHKPLSYADSLSTVFTMFKDLDNASSSGTTGRGKKNAKTLETPFGGEIPEGTRNPLYNDYQSAYP